MPLVNEELKTENFQGNQQTNFNQTNDAFNAQQAFSKPTGLFSLPPSVMNIVPWIPLLLEMTTGQKIPAMGGTIGEIQSSLQQIQLQVSQVLTQQQQLYTKLESLESNASSQLNSLSQQMQTFKLSATEIQRHLELSLKPKLE